MNQSTINICAPYIAILPDKSKVELPAGTVLREQTPADQDALNAVHEAYKLLDAGKFDEAETKINQAASHLGENRDVTGLRTMLHFLRPVVHAGPVTSLSTIDRMINRFGFLGSSPYRNDNEEKEVESLRVVLTWLNELPPWPWCPVKREGTS